MKIAVGDIIQIDPEHDPAFGGCLMVVSEVKSWGVQCYIAIPDKSVANASDRGTAFYRVENGKFEKTGGRIVWEQPT